ncbi:hypothetical protein HPB48_020929 [Haemaphysalis longicornis]|uniref:Uncharacterized protein n=1 Tax=Haemaphysalis longicornis TaxID=44386 RepID=A0A9J6FZD3_HAELO|nr:hypothetical protein HPB48_020929 [Haemaphysalis longicornis]
MCPCGLDPTAYRPHLRSRNLSEMTQYLAETAMAALSGIDAPQRGQSASQKAAGLYRSCVELGTSEKSEVSSLKDFTRKMDVDISSLSVPSTFKVAERLVQLSAEYGLSTYVRIGTNLQQNVKHINVLRYRPDITWMNRTENELARKGTLQGFFESYLRSYDQAIDVRAYQARITAAERKPDWLHMIRKYTGKKFKKSQLVTVWDNGALVMEYMIDSAGIGSADSRLLIGWSLVRRLTHLASGSLMTELYAPKIREFCFQTVRGVMEVAVANVYLEKFISQSTIDKATRMARMVMEQLKTKITQSRWMRGEVLAISKAKAANMGLVMGYSQDFNPLSRITKYYATFPDVNASFLPGYLKAHKAATRHFFAEDDAQNFTVGEANAFYHPGDNTLTLRAGIIQPPLFFTRGVSAMNFGGLGQVVGHEIMHGFDVGKILIDKDGYPATSTDPATLAEYERKVLCLRSAYQAVEQERQFTSIDPVYDSEGFADWAGLELAYSAYRSLPAAERDAAIPGLPLSAEQLFFVTHCFKWCGYTKQRLAGNRYWASQHALRRARAPTGRVRQGLRVPPEQQDEPTDEVHLLLAELVLRLGTPGGSQRY